MVIDILTEVDYKNLQLERWPRQKRNEIQVPLVSTSTESCKRGDGRCETGSVSLEIAD